MGFFSAVFSFLAILWGLRFKFRDKYFTEQKFYSVVKFYRTLLGH